MKKTIKLKLSTGSIQEARKELSDYKFRLIEKLYELNKKLADLGAQVISVSVNDAMGADDKNIDIDIQHNQEGNSVITRITVSGKNLLFLEYGSGIRFNQDDRHPWASRDGYGVGTYPGQTHAYDPNGWYYRKDGILHHSWGTKAAMPVYKAYTAIQEKIKETAKEVFK